MFTLFFFTIFFLLKIFLDFLPYMKYYKPKSSKRFSKIYFYTGNLFIGIIYIYDKEM